MGQELIQHDKAGALYIHRLTNWRFQDTASRNDVDNQFKQSDLDKMCYDMEDEQYYLLVSVDGSGVPTWYPLPSAFTPTGEANTASSVGAGTSLVLPKAGVDLPFKSLISGTNVTFTVDSETVTINASLSGGPFAPLSHVGAGGSEHALASGVSNGFMLAADYTLLHSLVSNATHTGDVIGSTALTIAPHAVTFAKMQAATGMKRLLGRGDSGAGDFQEITLGTGLDMVGQVLSMSVAGVGDMTKAVYDSDDDGVVDNSELLGGQTSAYHLDRTNHTGTQLSTTISDFTEATQDVIGAALVAGTNVTVTYSDVGNTITIASTSFEPILAAGTTAQYYRGDKSWQTLNATAVGLGNVDNTSDATKNAAVATLTNKTMSGASNTFLNIPNSALVSTTVTIGSTSVALGATTLTLAGLTSVAATTFTGALVGNASTATLATNVTTNANLTGPITSVGNTTSVAAQTGTGTTFVMNTAPTLVTPVLGVATGTSLAEAGTVLGAFSAGAAISSSSAYLSAGTVTDLAATSHSFASTVSHAITSNNGFALIGFRANNTVNQGAFNNTPSTGGLVGFYSDVRATGASGTVTLVSGFTALPQNTGAGVVTTLVGFEAQGVTNSGGGSIGTAVGFKCRAFTTGTVAYAAQLSLASGTNRWNLFADGTAANHMAGNLQLGSATPTAGAEKLQVAGTAAFTGLVSANVGINVGNVASATTTTLDWYEEGTFTPTAAGTTSAGAGTYSVQLGKYTRVGDIVHFQIELVQSVHTGTGNLKFTGLPFTSASTCRASPRLYNAGLAITAGSAAEAYIAASATEITVDQETALGVVSGVPIATGAATYIVTGSYKV